MYILDKEHYCWTTDDDCGTPYKTIAKVEMMQTPSGYIQVGDVIGYDRSNKRIRFGTVTRLTKDGFIYLKHSYCVVFGDDGKQKIYQSMDGSIEQYRVCKVL